MRLLLDDELRLTEEAPVLRRTTSLAPVATRVVELPVRETAVDAPVRDVANVPRRAAVPIDGR